MPDFANPQSLNRYSYVINNPLKYIDPTGHVACRTRDECTDMGTTPGGGFAKPKPKPKPDDGDDDNSCYASWPWYCGKEQSEPKPDPSDGISAPSGLQTSNDPPFGQTLSASKGPWYRDADVLSLSGVVGAGSEYVHRGLDLVCARRGSCVLFLVTGNHIDTHGNFLSPQAGFSLVASDLNSVIIRNRPTVDGIIEAYGGGAKQEGYSEGPYIHNSSSSIDSSGNLNFQTVTGGAGGTFGIPLAEYHIYTTYAEPIWIWP